MKVSNYSFVIFSTGSIDVQDAPNMNMIPRPTVNETDVKAPNEPFTAIGAVSLIYFGQ